MLVRRVVVFAILLAAASVARAQTPNMNGTWNGQYSLTDHCDNGATFTSNDTASAGFNQFGTLIIGSVTLQNLTSTNGKDCTLRVPETITIFVTGTVTGNSFAGLFLVPSDPCGPEIPLSGSVDSTSMTLSFPPLPTTSGTFTLSLSGSEAPNSQLTGSYTGTYDRTVSAQSRGCLNLPGSVSSSGPFTLAFLQSGGPAFASVTVIGSKDVTGNCTIDTLDESQFVVGTVSGNLFTAHDDTCGGRNSETWTVMFSGNTLSGSLATDDNTDRVVFNATRTSSVPPVVIGGFTADPSTINQGASATLSWFTMGATSVSMDRGIGSQASIGSVTVRPSATSTYNLTATGAAGSATATASITVRGTRKHRASSH